MENTRLLGKEECKDNDPLTDPQYFWLVNDGTSFAMSADGSQVNGETIKYDDYQLWKIQENGNNEILIINKGSSEVLTADKQNHSVKLEIITSPVADNQIWIIGENFLITTRDGTMAISSPEGSKQGQLLILSSVQPNPTLYSQWDCRPLPIAPKKHGYNQFKDFLPDDVFKIRREDSENECLTVTNRQYRDPEIVYVEVSPYTGSPNQQWKYDPTINCLKSVSGWYLWWYPYNKCLAVKFVPKKENTWSKTQDYIWFGPHFDTPVLKGDAVLVGEPNCGVLNYNPLDDRQKWAVELIEDEARTGRREAVTTKRVTVKIKTSSDWFSGCSHICTMKIRGNHIARPIIKKFGALNRGELAQLTALIPMDSPFDITSFTLHCRQPELWPIHTDWWKVKYVEFIIPEDDVHCVLTLNKWISNTDIEFNVPRDGWEKSNGAPIDERLCSYFIPMRMWFDDIKNWRTYDPTKIEGAGILVGQMYNHLVGETLKKPRNCVYLSPGWYSYVYTKADQAIVYWPHAQKRTGDYVRHSQIGGGNDVTVAGEFYVNKRGYYMTQVIVEVNNESGHYRPDVPCLYYISRKLESLGIEVEKIRWWTPK